MSLWHSFDRAKEGYWHLLPVQNTRTKAPGDSREMVAARRAFLSAGYYGIFGQALGELCLEYGQPKAGKPLRLLDAGCGEAGMTGASPGSSKRRASRWNWPVSTSQSQPYVWLRRPCPRPVRRGVQFPSAGAHRLGGCAAQLLLAFCVGGVSPRPAPRRTAHLRRAGCRASLPDEGRPLRKALQEPGAGSGVSGL